MESTVGPERNLLEAEPASCRQIVLRDPVISNAELAKLTHVNAPGFKSITLPMLWPVTDGAAGLERALEELQRLASQAIADGYNIIILTDRGVSRVRAAIPSLVATAAVHHHLVRRGERTRCGLVLETGDAREVHHMCLLIGYGAGAVVDRYFTGTASRVSGIGLDVLAEEVRRWHERAFPVRPVGHADLDWGGEYQWRRDGEYHLFNPDTVFKLQHATRAGQYRVYKEYTKLVDDQSRRLATLRGLIELQPAATPIPLDEVESVASILKRLAT